MTTTTSRRAVLAGIATAPALAAPALALTSAGPDSADWDPKAALARLEQMIDTLRTCVVCDGWHPNGLNEPAAARALAYFRAGCPEESDEDFVEREAAFDFISSHGQSLDWIICGDPGGLICRAAKHSMRVQTLAGPDPILALIEQHRAADAYWDKLNEEDETAWSSAADAAYAIADVLGQTQPTTLAGVLAIMRYRREHGVAFPGYHLFIPEGEEGKNALPGQCVKTWLATIEQSIAAIAGGAVS